MKKGYAHFFIDVCQFKGSGGEIMSHGPSTVWKEDHSTKYKTKLGVIMFLIYALIYGGFIFINVAFPQWMRKDVGSLNVAIIYGFGLIVVAIIQAFIYNHLCTLAERKAEREAEREAEAAEGGLAK
jgi:uncharacterized membrane protein (DUF485 family)